MKSLYQLILENNIDINNLLYKVELWFDNAVSDKQIVFKNIFDSLVADYKKRKYVNTKYIEGVISKGLTNEFEISCFVDFICDNLNRQCDIKESINYISIFKKIIQLVATC